MALTREEVQQIAVAIAGTVVALYREPISVADGLSQSMLEEAIAGNFYRRRADSADDETAKLYWHIAAEEDAHLQEFGKRLNEISQVGTQTTVYRLSKTLSKLTENMPVSSSKY